MHVSVELRRRIHRMLLDHLDLAALDRSKMADNVMRPRVRDALKRIVAAGVTRDASGHQPGAAHAGDVR
jgi:hypothetical protein